MICAACGEPTAGAPCDECGSSPLLDGRYRLEAALGSGSSGTTWRGSTMVDGHAFAPVAIKELRVANLDSIKARELVEREIRVLREVEHPAIPRYWEDLFVGKGRSKAIYIVQDFVDGQTLAEESRHRRYTEQDVFDIIAELLRILRYLHALRPPIVHRDVKPANVIRRIDGHLALIDFGSVRDCVKGDLGGSTVAGTFGYMAPEQFRGDAWPVTDLYGVGALAAALLSRKEPQSMLDWSGRLKWEEATSASPTMTAILRRLLAPDPMERFPSADDALAELGRARRPTASGPALRPLVAPRALKASLQRVAEAQPGTATTLSDARFALAPATDWGREHLPAPLIRWTSAVPRREEPPAAVPIYVSDRDLPAPLEPPAPLPRAVVALAAIAGMSVTMTVGAGLLVLAWVLFNAPAFGMMAPPASARTAALARPGLAPLANRPADTPYADPDTQDLLVDPSFRRCFRIWRDHNPIRADRGIAEIEITWQSDTPVVRAFPFADVPEGPPLDRCLAEAAFGAQPTLDVPSGEGRTFLITSYDLDDAGLGAAPEATGVQPAFEAW